VNHPNKFNEIDNKGGPQTDDGLSRINLSLAESSNSKFELGNGVNHLHLEIKANDKESAAPCSKNAILGQRQHPKV
jgi:hypothetical protein